MLVILNPNAGKAAPEEVRAALEAAFEPLRWRWRILEPSKEEAAPKFLRGAVAEAVQQGCKVVVAAGGDGTVSLVADALATNGAPVPLGILPLGTANILARELRIPLELPAAVLLLISGNRVREIDAMRVRDRHYFTQIGVGPDALMIEQTSREAQQKLGRLAYVISFLRRAFGHPSQVFRITIDDRAVRLRGWEVVLANARTMGAPPFVWGPDVNIGDGVVDLCVYNVRAASDYWFALWTLITRRHLQNSNARFFAVRRSVTIDSKRPLPVQADGESLGETPFEAHIVPHALRVLAPIIEEPGVEPAIDPRRQHMQRLALRARWDERVATLWHVDAAIFLWINRLPRTHWLDLVMTQISRSMHHGEGWLFFLGLGMLADFGYGWRAVLEVVPAMWLATLTVNYPIKALFRRSRPFLKHEDVIVVGRRPTDPSFPSGHSAAAFGGALLMSLQYPQLGPLWYLIALIVGFSRIYLGVHFPLDVAIGAVIGMVLAVVYSAILHALFPALGG